MDVRHDIDGLERVEVQRGAGWQPISDPAELGQCEWWVLRDAIAWTGLAGDREGMRVRAMLRRVVAALALPLLLAAAPAVAAAAPPRGGRVGTITRLVKLFLEKEAALQAVVRDGDAAAVGAMLADDFEMRTGARPDN